MNARAGYLAGSRWRHRMLRVSMCQYSATRSLAVKAKGKLAWFMIRLMWTSRRIVPAVDGGRDLLPRDRGCR
eukprot:9454603-Heterocapsa_arctica.AAC.1